jgi:hypothetical protein
MCVYIAENHNAILYFMSDNIPFITNSAPNISNKYCESIVADGSLIFHIDDLDKFYQALGYTLEMKMRGVLAEEFIWEEYVKSSSEMLTACYQKHIIEYMLKNSPSFKEQYGAQCLSWIAEHANVRIVSRKFCKKCNIKQFCPS